MRFDTNVDDMVVLVVDQKHQSYGQIGKMLYHDWKEYGGIGVRFSDGQTEEFYDGLIKGDPPSKIRRFYRHADDKGKEYDYQNVGPASLQREFVVHGGDLEKLARQYRLLFYEDLPPIINRSRFSKI